uniref:Uncharacterized protein n=1 Tax=Myoviridae sp. ctwmI4 TaxID=2826710 RepID=A0A8S5LU74_9CAUD|nr:MAG TPA: hypothetical protein [Myoviridae sp. ctwmI4]
MIICKTSKNAYKRKYAFLKHMNSNESIADISMVYIWLNLCLYCGHRHKYICF